MSKVICNYLEKYLAAGKILSRNNVQRFKFKGIIDYSFAVLTDIDMYSKLSNYYYAEKHFPDDSYTPITFIVNISYSNVNPTYNFDTF